jgi:hypothetical protein
MRIDHFASHRGCVFNEFSFGARRSARHTPYCDELIGTLWPERCPDPS